ncbi:MAG TPA: D-aminoacyl-tRNA deacylase [Candidatus Kapabacteria bacterium]
MRLLIQRVSRAKVTVSGEITGEIGQGLLIFVGIGHNDDIARVKEMTEKVIKLRIFEDEAGKMNLDVTSRGGSVLVVSQFTLYGDARKGNRPSFIDAARPEQAKELYDRFVSELREKMGSEEVAEGQFGAMMDVELVNDGPVTIWLES